MKFKLPLWALRFKGISAIFEVFFCFEVVQNGQSINASININFD